MYIVEFPDGTYLQERGGYDWGRADSPSSATHYDSPAQAQSAIPVGFSGRIMEDLGDGVVPAAPYLAE